MSAQLIYDLAPLGSIVRYSDGTPRPPERHRKKLAARESANGGGRLIRKTPARQTAQYSSPAHFTLHEGDYGSGGVIVLRVHKSFSVDCGLKFVVTSRPAPGSVRVFDRAARAPNSSILPPAARTRRSGCNPRISERSARSCIGRHRCGRRHRGEGGMNALPITDATTDNTSGCPEVYYGRTSDGLFAALVGENAFAMIPRQNGEHYLGHAWNLPLPTCEWKQSSFYGHGGQLDGKAAFRARVEENAEHQLQLRRLARRSIPARHAPP